MSVYRCVDKNIIYNIISDPKVIVWLTDDKSLNHDVVIHPQVIYIVNVEHTAVVRVDSLNSITCSVHIATLPEVWGKGHEFVKEALVWGFANTFYQKVVGIIPTYNKHVIKLVRDFNFKQEGILTKSFLKNWILYDQLIFGLNKGDF